MSPISHRPHGSQDKLPASYKPNTAPRQPCAWPYAYAESALLNAQALINAERPWMLTEIKTHTPSTSFTVYAINRGRTPAIILSAHMGCAAVKDSSALPENPAYGLGS